MSEKNKSKSSKKWLISRMKTSGSKRENMYSADYADTRNTKNKRKYDELPFHESMSSRFPFYDGKINTDLLKRFLRTRVGQNWDDVYSEVIERIPSKLQDYKFCVYFYVADKIEIREGQLWNLRDNSFIPTNNEDLYSHWSKNFRYMEYYVDPETKILHKIKDFESRKVTKGMNAKELQTFRENEQKVKLEKTRSKKTSAEDIEKLEKILKDRKQKDC